MLFSLRTCISNFEHAVARKTCICFFFALRKYILQDEISMFSPRTCTFFPQCEVFHGWRSAPLEDPAEDFEVVTTAAFFLRSARLRSEIFERRRQQDVSEIGRLEGRRDRPRSMLLHSLGSCDRQSSLHLSPWISLLAFLEDRFFFSSTFQ